MQQWILGGLGVAASLLYLWVARLQAKRRVSPSAMPARNAFTLWWATLAVIGIYSAMTRITGWGPHELGLLGARAMVYPLVALLLAACGGLVYYLTYLYTGAGKAHYIVTGYFSALFLYFVWFQEAHRPVIGPDPDQGGAITFHLAQEPAWWAALSLSLGIVLPLLAAAIGYGLLFFRTTDRTARYRIIMVSAGLVLWFGFSVLNALATVVAQTPPGFAREALGQALGVLAATMVLMAYEPPRGLRRRFGLRTVDQIVQPTAFEPPKSNLIML